MLLSEDPTRFPMAKLPNLYTWGVCSGFAITVTDVAGAPVGSGQRFAGFGCGQLEDKVGPLLGILLTSDQVAD